MTESQTAFELLLDIDRRCRLLAADLPSQEARVQSWSGIGFRLGDHWYVAPMGEIAEVLHEPRCTLIPGVKPWVKGVANLRGRLLPVMDLRGFLCHELSTPRKQRRVLVVEYQDVFVGLLVDEVVGMQHFAQELQVRTVLTSDETASASFIQGQFNGDPVWQIFSPFALVQAPGFMDVNP
ncbi:chemotaxis protein CheW [Pseudomonas sp. CCM 7891]|uniref:Chemotaxis protein CheW n=1 Tax=Pseudomonas karstica TaxID=1055468 RepID=A0A7X2RQT9_9PSED|nr:chemotaxis protein CheW [Pseudomonas karstica]MTD18474.1 chemotaxis protein CheW [Pseudomonas karstica]